MKLGRTSLFWLFLLMIAVGCTRVSVVNASNGDSPELMENIGTNVDCTSAKVCINSMVGSQNTTLMHFPSGVNLNDSSLVNATSIWLHFLPVPLQSLLVYEFNNTDAADARAIADTLTLTINTAFQTTFTWNSTRTSDSIANVTYTGPGKANLTEYTEWLMPRCLASDLRGFSLTFLPMTRLGANLIVTASKDSGGFEWGYMMMTTHLTWIPVGSNSHKIDILDLLNVDSLEPSPYALTPEGTYSSMVMLIISSNETVLYAGCEPGLINPPTQFRGWMYQLLTPQPP